MPTCANLQTEGPPPHGCTKPVPASPCTRTACRTALPAVEYPCFNSSPRQEMHACSTISASLAVESVCGNGRFESSCFRHNIWTSWWHEEQLWHTFTPPLLCVKATSACDRGQNVIGAQCAAWSVTAPSIRGRSHLSHQMCDCMRQTLQTRWREQDIRSICHLVLGAAYLLLTGTPGERT